MHRLSLLFLQWKARLSTFPLLPLPVQLGIFLGCLLPLLWLSIAFALQHVQDRILTEERKETENLIRVFAEEVRSSVHVVDMTLIDLREHWLHEPQHFAVRVQSRQAYLAKDVAFQVAIIDPKGVLAFSSVDPQAKPVDLSDREHFRVHRESGKDFLFISKPVFGRVSQRWSIQFTRPLLDARGQFAGVIVLSVSPDYFTRFSHTIDLGARHSIGLARTTGEVIARSPAPAQGLGETLRDVPFLHTRSPEIGFFRRVSQIDGIERLYTWRSLPNYKLAVSIGRSMDHVLGAYRQQRQVYLWGGAGISVLLALLGYILLAGLRQRARARAALEESEFRWKYALEGGAEGVWDWNTRTNEVFYSKRWKEMLGYADHDIENRLEAWERLLHPEDKPRVLAATADYLSGESQSYVNEFRLRCKDNSWKWIFSRGMAVSRDSSGKPARIIGMHADIGERKQAEESMHLAVLVYENSNEGMLVTDADDTILTINQAFTDLTGYAAHEVIGKKPNILNSGRHETEFFEAMRQAITTTGRWQGEIWNRRKNGDVFAEWLSINTIYNRDNGVHRRVALFSDLAKKKEYEQLIWQQANCDPLTGLLNRRIFLERLAQEIRRAQRSHHPMALLFLDLDHFKEVNDTLGHATGDLLLQEAARRLRNCVRGSDHVARLGGDEFTVIIGELHDIGHVTQVAKDILRTLREPFQLGMETAFISTSIGITLCPQDAVTVDELLKHADQAMYAAKNQGRNRFHFFTPSMQEAAQARMRLTNDLRGALAGNQFQVVYQPIVKLATSRIHKAEALIRWHHPNRGLVSPAEFIPVAERTGMIRDIGDWVFGEAARQVKRIRTVHHADFQISVNKSPAQFRDGTNTWVDYLMELGLPGRSLIIEITEGLLLDANRSVADKLAAFRASGMQIALDDFGTGYSSLSYLQKLDIDYIKIDQAFVRNLVEGSDDLALCKSMIAMAHTLGLEVVAEGIETAEQCELLTDAGCDYGQGYLFSRPMPAAEFEAFLNENWIELR